MSEDFVKILQRARVKRTRLSPTRRNNPQPFGLVYQSPLHPNATHLAIWNHENAFKKTISRFPDLTKHIGMLFQYSRWCFDHLHILPFISNYAVTQIIIVRARTVCSFMTDYYSRPLLVLFRSLYASEV